MPPTSSPNTQLVQAITLIFSLLCNLTSWTMAHPSLPDMSVQPVMGAQPGMSGPPGMNGLPSMSGPPEKNPSNSPPGPNLQDGSQLAQPPSAGGSASAFPLRFSSPAASQFYVDGSRLPFVEFDAGPSYAGLLPVSSDPNEQRKFFFWFWPAAQPVGANDLTFWTNGGPGCSSLESMLQETGPISWKYGQARPTQNPSSWTNATSMLYVEHPIGTGYSVGRPTATNETDISRDLFGFFIQWLQVFPEMCGKNFWLSGESYAGYYVSYLADFIYKYQSSLNLKLMGIYLANPTLSWMVMHEQIPIVPMVKRYQHVFAFNQTFMDTLTRLHQECGYADYLAKYEVYPPPPAPFADPGVGSFMMGQPSNYKCDTFSMVLKAAHLANPAFNVYNILDIPPAFWDVLDAPQRWPGMQGDAVYFNREDVKQALNVPNSGKWVECSPGVLPLGDASLPPAVSVLPSVIERSKRSVIVQGQIDMVMITQGARLILQNMTWGNAQGFRKPINTDFIVKDQGSTGRFATERGLTFVEVEKAGHMVPQYQPQAAFQILQFLLGQVESPSASWPPA
ncbi:hypothetical protein PCANC_27097 [Puccinia coronata f. sp. avenae]|uniref:Carboxypeptidase n=2 Tax=Puccinia coronata f. sp. avenae TaxID=200324 RepID=A0A2N5SJL0_9BASI|nr:hypothetical protein PCASD_20515 [Puccinia coronata f. sp. avenae]PLW26594.1 hypothetical protein PCANC_27097 [Puccinia coronata f. sp. avenae]PLW36861.1 hypothetical protein PCASD_15273 [Puccinia coronata f. sp. avenae]